MAGTLPPAVGTELPTPRRAARGAEDQVTRTRSSPMNRAATLKLTTPSDREIVMTRVITISRSEGVVSFNVAARFIGELLVLVTWSSAPRAARRGVGSSVPTAGGRDRKSTRLNSSHLVISYAVFCLKKKK